MTKYVWLLAGVLAPLWLCSQEKENFKDNEDVLDWDYYMEDQLYVSLTYNFLFNLPAEIKQVGFSNGFRIGLIMDFPVTRQGNFGFGAGLGYSSNIYFQNLRISTNELNGATEFTILKSGYDSNYFSTHFIELPFEFRFRTSGPDKYKYFRLYLGGDLGYMVSENATFRTNNVKVRYYNHGEFRRWSYGLRLTLGYGAWNLYTHYRLNEIFKDDVSVNKVTTGWNSFEVGLLFFLF